MDLGLGVVRPGQSVNHGHHHRRLKARGKHGMWKEGDHVHLVRVEVGENVDQALLGPPWSSMVQT